MVALEQLRNWCNGTWLSGEKDGKVSRLVIDSRTIRHPEHALFIALSTDRRDGHQFISDAWEKGTRMFLVARQVSVADFPESSFILVPDTLEALQQIVAGYRLQFDLPVIGITGSNGKTVVKEWIGQLLADRYRLLRSPRSYNSQIGVPLSVWQLGPEHQLAVFEAGISRPGEMDRLEKIIQPDIGIITNIGEAHSEGFTDMRHKIREKLLLFRRAKQLIYCPDDPVLHDCVQSMVQDLQAAQDAHMLQTFTWSRLHDNVDLRITAVVQESQYTRIDGIYYGAELSVRIPFSDSASVENAIHCWCVMLLLQIPYEDIATAMEHLQPVAMRLELRHGINGCTIINDTYNSDLTSLNIALDYLQHQRQHKKRTVILSDMLQSGKPDKDLYREVADALSRRGVQRFIGVGDALYAHQDLIRAHHDIESVFFRSTAELLQQIHRLQFEQEAILLKGARLFGFEKISAILEQEIHQTVLSVNLSAVTHNLNVFRKHTAAGVKIMAMVKAFSYGSGSYEIAHMLQYAGVDYLGVAYTDEGVELRKAGITLPIMVMSPDAGSFDRMIAWKLEPEVFNFRSLEAFTRVAATLQVRQFPVHIKLDTGMHRLGFLPGEIDTLISILQQDDHVHVASIFSHLAASEDKDQDEFTAQQASVFRQMSDKLIDALGYAPLRHLCNSAAIIRHQDLHFDMVRLGLGLYGIDSSGLLGDQLQEAGILYTSIAQIKEIPAGDTIGYNRRGRAVRDMRIAVICIGYADGYPRALGNGIGYVLIHGRKAVLTGAVCMDMCMVDVTDIPEAQEGDEVVVFGPDLSPRQLAAWAGTIPYEIMTGISQRVKRVYVSEM